VAIRAAMAWLAWHRAASAAGSTVVIVYDLAAAPSEKRAELRLAAELRAGGFEVEERASEGASDARQIIEETRSGVAFATVLLERASDGATTDVWVTDHVTRKIVGRRIAAGGAGDAADRALALRVVELMRASLVEGLVMPQVDGPPSPPPSAHLPSGVSAWVREGMKPSLEPSRSVDLGLGITGVWGGPQLGLAVAPELHLAWRPSSSGWVGLLAVGPAFGARVVASQGSATVRQEFVVAEAGLEPLSGSSVRPTFSIGAGAYHLAATGYAAAPYTTRTDDVWSALLIAGVGARMLLSPSASLALDARALFAVPRPEIAFAEQQVAVAMRPGALAGLLLLVNLR
jgi:hypothetical protein